ncbi:TetR/AcrR family transcriptional regulator [Micromonospora sp. NPDC004704]
MRAPRKDQLRNRQKLLASAQETFTEHGPDIKMEEVAHRAGLAVSSLYRHFPTKDDLVVGVLDAMIRGVQEGADRAASIEDPYEAFRTVFTQSCAMRDEEVATFAKLAALSRRTQEHARRLIADVVGPATTRLRAAGGLRKDITIEDVAAFVRMADLSEGVEQRGRILDVILTGLRRDPAERQHPSRP